jgi:uncharacterized protein YndB with AHSA1/START domain
VSRTSRWIDRLQRGIAGADTRGMRIHEEVVTRAAPARVWEMISDPSIHGLWNPRIVDTDAPSHGPIRVGQRYRITYELSGRTSEFEAEVVEMVPEQRFVARLEERFKGDGSNWQRFMEERYTLAPRGDRTRVVHEVHIHHPGIHPLLRLLVWFIMTFGKPQGQTFMERFAELAEDRKPGTRSA